MKTAEMENVIKTGVMNMLFNYSVSSSIHEIKLRHFQWYADFFATCNLNNIIILLCELKINQVID